MPSSRIYMYTFRFKKPIIAPGGVMERIWPQVDPQTWLCNQGLLDFSIFGRCILPGSRSGSCFTEAALSEHCGAETVRTAHGPGRRWDLSGNVQVPAGRGGRGGRAALYKPAVCASGWLASLRFLFSLPFSVWGPASDFIQEAPVVVIPPLLIFDKAKFIRKIEY